MPDASESVSVVIPAYGACPHLPEVVDALLAQTRPALEIIVVHSGRDDPGLALSSKADAVRVVHSERRLLAGAARNLGLQQARAEWVAFLDADVWPTRPWLECLLDAARGGPDRFVVGSLGAEVGGGYWGLCLWVTEFSSVHPYLPDGEQEGGASANMLVTAEALRRHGGFPTGFQPGEDTILAARLREAGMTQWFCAGAEARHYNVGGLRHYLAHQYGLGKWSAACRRAYPLRGALAARYWPLAPALWLARLVLILGRTWPRERAGWRKVAPLLPGILLGLLVWNLGFLSGLRVDIATLLDPGPEDRWRKNARDAP